jgi:type I restriction enzyme S subunit
VNSADVKALEVRMPIDTDEQEGIAAALSDMDAELAAVEQGRDADAGRVHPLHPDDQRLAKTRALKQGMMQELLTGRTRLV